ncbi:DUF4041 domain-containing protein [Trichocoleus desertorum AS-A10]|uniref:DUF4041 domain-containing protein n=1 Tax=Trichocoleus desertorum TaxID=1481672 RepID=UPI00329A4361
MTYLLLFLSLGLTTALVVVLRQKQQRQNELAIAQQRLKEFDRKYGGLISKDEAEKQLEAQIKALTEKAIVLTQQSESKEREIADKTSALQARFEEQASRLTQQAKAKKQEIDSQISILQSQLKELEEQDFIESFGFYESKYDFQEAEEYKQRLDQIRSDQKQMVKDKTAAVCNTQWEVSGSIKEGKKMTDNFLKLALRAFNGECDAAVAKVKYSNVQPMENRIRKAYESLNKLSVTTHCEITPRYLDLKLQELWLAHEYQEKRYQEQEEQRAIREQMREEERASRELEKSKQEAEQEERRYQEALEKAQRDVETTTGKAQEKLQRQIEELQQRLAEAEARQRAVSQAQMTKMGFVYVISNIGSFGEGVYKIGMTRRLEPMDRVKELGDASVPFPFDVHAMISCENAPAIESLLHQRFNHRRVNKINERKEFFRVSIEEIVAAVQDIDEELQTCRSEVRFTKAAEAAEFRKTCAKERDD